MKFIEKLYIGDSLAWRNIERDTRNRFFIRFINDFQLLYVMELTNIRVKPEYIIKIN